MTLSVIFVPLPFESDIFVSSPSCITTLLPMAMNLFYFFANGTEPNMTAYALHVDFSTVLHVYLSHAHKFFAFCLVYSQLIMIIFLIFICCVLQPVFLVNSNFYDRLELIC